MCFGKVAEAQKNDIVAVAGLNLPGIAQTDD